MADSIIYGRNDEGCFIRAGDVVYRKATGDQMEVLKVWNAHEEGNPRNLLLDCIRKCDLEVGSFWIDELTTHIPGLPTQRVPFESDEVDSYTEVGGEG